MNPTGRHPFRDHTPGRLAAGSALFAKVWFFMHDFHRLLAFTRAAENCYGLARQIVDGYSDAPEFSRFLSVEGRPYCQPTANWQARSHMDGAEKDFAALEDAVREWDGAARVAVDYVQKAASNQHFPVISVLGSSCASAHEAARQFAQAVRGVFSKVAGDGDIEQAFDLARLLVEFRTVPDFSAFIARESLAAEDLTPALPDDEEPDEVEVVEPLEADPAAVYFPRELHEEMGVSAPTWNTAARGAGVTPCRRGQRDHRYTKAERLAVLKYFADNSPTLANKKRAQELLEIEKKSK
ncbi:hypothetical protein [Lacipirellula parvula]|uniref:Uncharacterized protein n=1 Tax=Lacipirellula parvula TaxID=2650471 RepID=A0A5K7XFB1_9BACT|nr:hypothetical protein [Lacipirellula parvula]BBO34727.1 hypothetical protein PLANPX_4339 [Lacipirellula parvula]